MPTTEPSQFDSRIGGGGAPAGRSRQPRAVTARAAGVMVVLVSFAIVSLMLALAGCTEHVTKADPAPPPPTFTGPVFLQGSVGSLATLRGYEPMLVSGYGLVVMPPGTGTGSAQVPVFLREWMINEMRRKGLGSIRLGTQDLPPDRVLVSTDTAVVAVQGFIPPGATKGEHFDVLVSALPLTDATSLESGRLWTTDLSIAGTNVSMRYVRPLAEARGDLYLDPLEDEADKEKRTALARQGVVLAGGVVTEDRRIELYLNQASWQRSRLMADRINERFYRGPDDRDATAVAKTDVILRLNVPRRFAGRTEEFLSILSHLYLQREPNFAPQQAQRLADVLLTEPKFADDVAWAWEALGKTALPVIRAYYNHPDQTVGLTALRAGVRLEDENASEPLAQLALNPDAAVRRNVARLLVHLPNSLRGVHALKLLLDDEDRSVRIEAYESLAAMNDPTIKRVPIGDRTKFKFLIDLVPSQHPLVYVSHTGVPRLVLFHPHTGFKAPMLASLWEGRLRLRADSPDQPITIFYQAPNEARGRTYTIQPTVANLALLLAHTPTPEQPTDGLDLTYSQVINAVHNLAKAGDITAKLELKTSPLADLVARSLHEPSDQPRPEFDPNASAAAGVNSALSPYAPLTQPSDAANPAAPPPRPAFGEPDKDGKDQPNKPAPAPPALVP